jgi:hypothetical protein
VYSPLEKRGYDGAKTDQKLPKAPTGGTGQTTLAGTNAQTGGNKKP